MKLKIIAIGDSIGILLPEELLAQMRWSIGEELFATELADGRSYPIGDLNRGGSAGKSDRSIFDRGLTPLEKQEGFEQNESVIGKTGRLARGQLQARRDRHVSWRQRPKTVGQIAYGRIASNGDGRSIESGGPLIR